MKDRSFRHSRSLAHDRNVGKQLFESYLDNTLLVFRAAFAKVPQNDLFSYLLLHCTLSIARGLRCLILLVDQPATISIENKVSKLSKFEANRSKLKREIAVRPEAIQNRYIPIKKNPYLTASAIGFVSSSSYILARP